MLYTFECTNEECNEVFERDIKMADIEDTTVLCPKCHELSKRIMSNPCHYKHFSWASWRVGQ